MIIKPKIRGFICTTAHPVGCARNVQEQIDYVKASPVKAPRKVLVIGSSTGYGLSSRITTAFGSGAATIGVFYERPSENGRTATAGWYNSLAFDEAAHKAGLYTHNFNADAFGNKVKKLVLETIKKDLGQVDAVIYSVAAPRRVHPQTGEILKSTLKPIKAPYTSKNIDVNTAVISEITLPAATPDEIRHTVGVMGGEDWQMWMTALTEAGVLAKNALTLAYSYIGPEITRPVYREGTIGAAKDHLELTARQLDAKLTAQGGRALVSVNKALVTQSSSAIPIIPLYFALLLKVMRDKQVDEDCIRQIHRLFKDRINAGSSYQDIPLDDHGRVRIDDFELRPDVQEAVMAKWKKVDTANIQELADMKGYHGDFLKLFGFGRTDVNYDEDLNQDLQFAQDRFVMVEE